MSNIKILTLVGSLRQGSINLELAETVALNLPDGVELIRFEGLADIPFYNEDADTASALHPAAAALRQAADRADAVLVISPEYNGTIPAVLKNAIDWLSRPFGAGAISGKPAAVIGSAFGQYGGVWAHDDARRSLGVAGAHVLGDVKLSIGGSLVRFAELHPKDDQEVVDQLVAVVRSLAGAPAPLQV